MTRERIQYAKHTQPCKQCGRFCHWFGGHDEVGGLNNDVLSSSTAAFNSITASPHATADNKLVFSNKSAITITISSVAINVTTSHC